MQLLVAFLAACGSGGTGGGTVGVPPIGKYETPPSSSDPPPSSSDLPVGTYESPGTSEDPVGDATLAGCLPCEGYVSCTGPTGEVGTARLSTAQGGDGCELDGFQELTVLACGGIAEIQNCSFVPGPPGQPGQTVCTSEPVGTWHRAGDGTVTFCSEEGCETCTPTDATPVYPGVPGGQGYEAGIRAGGGG